MPRSKHSLRLPWSVRGDGTLIGDCRGRRVGRVEPPELARALVELVNRSPVSAGHLAMHLRDARQQEEASCSR